MTSAVEYREISWYYQVNIFSLTLMMFQNFADKLFVDDVTSVWWRHFWNDRCNRATQNTNLEWTENAENLPQAFVRYQMFTWETDWLIYQPQAANCVHSMTPARSDMSTNCFKYVGRKRLLIIMMIVDECKVQTASSSARKNLTFYVNLLWLTLQYNLGHSYGREGTLWPVLTGL